MTTNHMTIREIMTKPEYLAFERALMREYGNHAPAESLRHEYRPNDGPKPCGSGSGYLQRREATPKSGTPGLEGGFVRSWPIDRSKICGNGLSLTARLLRLEPGDIRQPEFRELVSGQLLQDLRLLENPMRR